MTPSTTPTPAKEFEKTEAELRKASEDLKARIEEAKKRNDMPLDSTLGNPKWDQDASDGHLDRRDDDDE
jgi:hypothetical protein